MTLERFLQAQEKDYPVALSEIRAGKKRSHWMWYIFPQLKSLGRSETAWHYGITDKKEAEAYLRHPLLGKRLTEISTALLELPGHDANAIFGFPDDRKLHSSMTLFASLPNAPQVFQQVIDKYFNSIPDPPTTHLLTNS